MVGRAKFGIDFTRFVMKAPAPVCQPSALLRFCELWDAKCDVCLHFNILMMQIDSFSRKINTFDIFRREMYDLI